MFSQGHSSDFFLPVAPSLCDPGLLVLGRQAPEVLLANCPLSTGVSIAPLTGFPCLCLNISDRILHSSKFPVGRGFASHSGE